MTNSTTIFSNVDITRIYRLLPLLHTLQLTRQISALLAMSNCAAYYSTSASRLDDNLFYKECAPTTTFVKKVASPGPGRSY
ncbi:uncharacterized protein PHALS_14908 [Plasmopara halstedii]|uniref:Uncharacterized protein n=1 Tax=Plasmopara halstedii TaxID=4781 RepID=A0A0P1A8S5_PLAHL|nr:uncharacterized protein PHALS_14908 [Plasmopara halstedii]CEG36578.1 hypothetical protein PHALS_14908 [Plasmopara halstedii]|eukprot:XP_024572947.1 hypothetical protein PHALS_14908 [Plasmopara halstedii]